MKAQFENVSVEFICQKGREIWEESHKENSYMKTLGRRKISWLLAKVPNGVVEEVIAST